jgi:uncharacterized protein YndB with AHSA1/START domain
MEIDLNAAVGAVTREVLEREHEGRTAKVVVATRTYDADIDDVWDAITTAERIARWLAPISGDLRLGGRYQIEGNAGGIVTTCEPPTRLAATWEFGGGVSWLEVTLSPDGDGTTLRLEHMAHVDEHWGEYGPGAVGIGWDLALLGLANHLAGGEPVDPEAFGASEEAKDFMRASSDRWGDADIAGGAPEAEARAAAARTTAAYLGG